MPRFIPAALLVALIHALLAGCSDRLLRESVLASTQSTIGLSIGQNPHTQLYEGKVGYARSELFLVPTGKRVVNTRGEQAPHSDQALQHLSTNNADVTPEVLGEILADGVLTAAPVAGAAQPARVGVYQRLAVGKLAVTAPAAVVLMARDPHALDAAARPAQDDTLEELAARSAAVRFVVVDGRGKAAPAAWDAAADAWSRELGFASYDALYANGSAAVHRALVQRWTAELRLARARANARPATAAPATPTDR